MSFYQELFATASANLPTVDMNIMRKGGMLDRAQQIQLVAPVTRRKVELDLQGISNLMTLGKDGLNLVFFKKIMVSSRRIDHQCSITFL